MGGKYLPMRTKVKMSRNRKNWPGDHVGGMSGLAKRPLRLSKGFYLPVYKTNLYETITPFLVFLSRLRIRLVRVDSYRMYCWKDHSDQ